MTTRTENKVVEALKTPNFTVLGPASDASVSLTFASTFFVPHKKNPMVAPSSQRAKPSWKLLDAETHVLVGGSSSDVLDTSVVVTLDPQKSKLKLLMQRCGTSLETSTETQEAAQTEPRNLPNLKGKESRPPFAPSPSYAVEGNKTDRSLGISTQSLQNAAEVNDSMNTSPTPSPTSVMVADETFLVCDQASSKTKNVDAYNPGPPGATTVPRAIPIPPNPAKGLVDSTSMERLRATNEMESVTPSLEDEAQSPIEKFILTEQSLVVEQLVKTYEAVEDMGYHDDPSTRAESSPLQTLLVLYSGQTFDRQVASRQQLVFSILDAKRVTFERMDGADPAFKERRTELFSISNRRGIYPQFFLVSHSKSVTEYWGDYDRFEYSNEMGTLLDDLGGSHPTTVPAPASVPMEGCHGEPSDNRPNEITGTPLSTPTLPSKDDILHLRQKDQGSVSGAPQAVQGASVPASSGKATLEFGSKLKAPPEANPGKVRGEKAAGQEPKAAIEAEEREMRGTDAGSNKVDITIYGATSFVAQHILSYLCQVSLSLPRPLKVTLAGRSPSKLEYLLEKCSGKMNSLITIYPDSTGSCIFDVFVAESSDTEALRRMGLRTCVVLNCAGPFAKYSEKVVAACALTGCDYVDITGEVGWASEMREKYGPDSASSGSRIISFCGFDSVPSDLSVFAAVRALQVASKNRSVDVATATTYHSIAGGFNGGTIHTIIDMPVALDRFLHRVPYFLEDPLALASSKVRADPSIHATRNRLALAEWMNQLPSIESIFRLGISIPFFMAPANTKIVHATAFALKYGQRFVYRERHVPAGFKMTTKLGLLSIIPALSVMSFIGLCLAIFKFPILGKKAADYLFPPGSGCSEKVCRSGYAEVYAEVGTARNEAGLSDKGYCLIKFQGGECSLECVSSIDGLPCPLSHFL